MSHFDTSVPGFWRSFYAAVVVAPVYVLLMVFYAILHPVDAGPVRWVVVEAIAYVIEWTAFPLAMVTIARWLSRSDNYIRYIVAHNWANVLGVALFLPVAAITAINPALVGLMYMAMIAVFVYQWYVARTALVITGGEAGVLMVFNLVLSLFINVVASAML
ncbi:MAG: hypothetical protein V3U44_07625 [Alphaproteobacteria bacterium]